MKKLRIRSVTHAGPASPRTRKSYSIKICCLAALLSVFPASLYAVTGLEGLSEDELREARWYQVELIVFAHKNKSALEAEHWQTQAGMNLPDEVISLTFPASPVSDTSLPVSGTLTAPAMTNLAMNTVSQPGLVEIASSLPPIPAAFEMLADEELKLASIVKKLRNSRQFEPMLHLAWRQPTFDRGQATPVLLFDGMDIPPPAAATDTAGIAGPATDSTGTQGSMQEVATPLTAPIMTPPRMAIIEDNLTGPTSPRLVGTVELSVARYLHLKTDLFFRQMVSQQSASRIADAFLWFNAPYPPLRTAQGPAYQLHRWQALRGFELKESRRMRSSEIHYLDHPLFGVVALITPFEVPKPIEDEGEIRVLPPPAALN